MKLLIKIFTVIIFLSGLSFAQDCTSVLSINTDNPSALIYLNGILIGQGNTNIEVEKGKYLIEVRNDSSVWNAASNPDTIVVNDCGQNFSFNFKVEEKIYLRSNPADAYVYADDTLLGHTPLFIPSGVKELKLLKPGYEEAYINPSTFAKGQVINLNYSGIEKEGLFIQQDIFKILVGSAVVLGGLTAYFKLKADDYFEDYQFTGSRELLDKTHQYDLISGITFGALQINFGILIYYLLTD